MGNTSCIENGHEWSAWNVHPGFDERHCLLSGCDGLERRANDFPAKSRPIDFERCNATSGGMAPHDWAPEGPNGTRRCYLCGALRTPIEKEHDPVNHPSHYNQYKGLEIIDLTEQMNFNLGNAVKYIARAGHKDPDKTVEDLQKAIWYTEREIKRLTS